MENYTGADPLAEWCAREMKLNIDGKELIVKPTMQHYRKLRALIKNPKEAQENAEKMTEVFKEILQTTFPNSSSVDDFLERYENKLQIALMAEIIGIPQEELKKKFMQIVSQSNEKQP